MCSPCSTCFNSKRSSRSSHSDFLLSRPDRRTSCSGREASQARSCSCATGPRLNQERRNHGMQRTARRAAADAERVCQAWHRTSEVQVLVPGIRGAEGEEKGKGVHREVGSGGSPIQTRGATNRNRRGGVA